MLREVLGVEEADADELYEALDWTTSLRAPTIRKLWREGPLQLSLFDERDLAEITSPDFPGERARGVKGFDAVP